MTAAQPTPRAAAWGRHVALVLLALAGLYLVFGIYLTGEIYWAMAALAVLGLALYVYGSPRVLAWKYLLPGVLAMVVFVAFPLLYTTRIGFTNFSSTHLLGEQAARAYLLEQTEPREASTFHYAVRKRADGVQLALWPVDGPPTPQWVTAPFALGAAATAQPLPLQPATAADAAAAPQYTLRELIAQRDTLRALQLQLPDGTVLSYAGVREFAPLQPLWRAAPGDAVQEVATGTVYRPDR
ncbi:MAG: maltose ABC transporter permease MalF, partial [Betaproteobacteria bacterium]|nr:maltose ABC transporter permease MalF [Betaproteobacteria bacterium]